MLKNSIKNRIIIKRAIIVDESLQKLSIIKIQTRTREQPFLIRKIQRLCLERLQAVRRFSTFMIFFFFVKKQIYLKITKRIYSSAIVFRLSNIRNDLSLVSIFVIKKRVTDRKWRYTW